MTKLDQIITPVTSPDEARTRLKSLAAEWGPEEFWSLESCIETLSTQKSLLSAAAAAPSSQPDGDCSPYQGWYFAACQGNDCELLFIYPSKIHRGLGLGKALLQDLIARAGQAGEIASIFLEVRKSNQNAIKLYEHNGFMLISKRPSYYSNGEDALVYRLDLKKQ